MPFGGRLAWARVITWGCTLAPPGEYDWLICATAAMRAAVTITVTVCCYCRRRVVIRYISVVDNNNNTINNTSRCFSRFKCWLRQRLQRGRRWLAKVAAHIRPARLIGSRLHHTKSETPLSVAPMFKKATGDDACRNASQRHEAGARASFFRGVGGVRLLDHTGYVRSYISAYLPVPSCTYVNAVWNN